MKLLQFLPFLGLASAAAPTKRQADAAIAAFNRVTSNIRAFNDAITNFNGDAGPLQRANDVLISDLRQGVGLVQTAPAIDLSNISPALASAAVAQGQTYIRQLQESIDATVANAMMSKNKLVQGGQGPFMLEALTEQRALSGQLVDALISRTPSGLQDMVTPITGPLLASLDRGVAAYQDQAGASTPAPAPRTGTPTTPANAAAPPPAYGAGTVVPAGTRPATPSTSSTRPPAPASFDGAASMSGPTFAYVVAAAGLLAAF